MRDHGTWESERKRAYLVNGSDHLELSSTPIDVAYARKLVTQDQRSAAIWLRITRARVFGRAGARTIDLDGLSATTGSSIADAQALRWERQYARAMAKLTEDEQAEAIAISMDLVPRWLRQVIRGVPIGAEEEQARVTLLSALDKLA
jgi:hypothetical protein